MEPGLQGDVKLWLGSQEAKIKESGVLNRSKFSIPKTKGMKPGEGKTVTLCPGSLLSPGTYYPKCEAATMTETSVFPN